MSKKLLQISSNTLLYAFLLLCFSSILLVFDKLHIADSFIIHSKNSTTLYVFLYEVVSSFILLTILVHLRTISLHLSQLHKESFNTSQDQKLIKHQDQKKIEELTASRDEALVSARTKSQLLGTVCNDFQQLLKEVLQLFSYLLSTNLSAECKHSIEHHQISADRLLTLTDELLGYAQLEEGNIHFVQKEFNLYKLLFDTKDLLHVHSLKRRQQLRLMIEDTVPENIIGDAPILQNVLLHFASQSIRSTETDGVINIKVDIGSETDDIFTLNFSITDTGGSLLAKRRFEAITHIKESNIDHALSIGGGLGVMISERLIKLMGGSLHIDQQIGFGMRYALTIPFLKVSAQEQAQHSNFQNQTSKSSPQVLIVEDNVINQKLTTHLFQKRGFEVEVVGSGEEALELLEHKNFNLILMDICLPVLDGIEITKRIRTSGKPYQKIPIIALTAHTLKNDRDRCLENGMDGYLVKPLDPKALTQILENLSLYKHSRNGFNHSHHAVPEFKKL